MTHYETLGLPPDADSGAIKAAYRRAASAAHPDREGGSQERMSKVNQAYAVLSDPKRKEQYDATGEDDEPVPLEKKAESHFMTLFAQALGQPGNVVKAIREELERQGRQIDTQVDSWKHERRMLEKRGAQIKYKGAGRDLARAVLDQRLRTLDAQLADAAEAHKVLNLTHKIAAEYESAEAVLRQDAAPQSLDDLILQMARSHGFGAGSRAGG